MLFPIKTKRLSNFKNIKYWEKNKKITKKYKVKFLINDSFKIAKLVNADGCHIGQSDGTNK